MIHWRIIAWYCLYFDAFSWMKMYEFKLKFQWSLFLRVQVTIFRHWLRDWLGADQATSHFLSQWWLLYWRIYASPRLNGFNVPICKRRAFTKTFPSLQFLGPHLIFSPWRMKSILSRLEYMIHLLRPYHWASNDILGASKKVPYEHNTSSYIYCDTISFVRLITNRRLID